MSELLVLLLQLNDPRLTLLHDLLHVLHATLRCQIFLQVDFSFSFRRTLCRRPSFSIVIFSIVLRDRFDQNNLGFFLATSNTL